MSRAQSALRSVHSLWASCLRGPPCGISRSSSLERSRSSTTSCSTGSSWRPDRPKRFSTAAFCASKHSCSLSHRIDSCVAAPWTSIRAKRSPPTISGQRVATRRDRPPQRHGPAACRDDRFQAQIRSARGGRFQAPALQLCPGKRLIRHFRSRLTAVQALFETNRGTSLARSVHGHLFELHLRKGAVSVPGRAP